MAELVGVARSGYGKVPGPGRTGGRGTRDGRVGSGPGRVECKVSGFVTIKPRELASGVDDHRNVLGRRSDCDGDYETHIVMKWKLVWGFWEGPRWYFLGFDG